MKDLQQVTDQLTAEFNRLFEPSDRALPAGVEITQDANLAKWLSDLAGPPRGRKRSSPAPGELWTETLESVTGNLSSRYMDEMGRTLECLDILERQCGRLETIFDLGLKKIKMKDFGDTACVYGKIAILHRALECSPKELGEVLIQSLRAGGLPCGCEGTWPEKPVVVYWPHKVAPTFA